MVKNQLGKKLANGYFIKDNNFFVFDFPLKRLLRNQFLKAFLVKTTKVILYYSKALNLAESTLEFLYTYPFWFDKHLLSLVFFG